MQEVHYELAGQAVGQHFLFRKQLTILPKWEIWLQILGDNMSKTTKEPQARNQVRDGDVTHVKLRSGKTVTKTQYNSFFRFRKRSK